MTAFIPENDERVVAAVERILALRQMADDEEIQTYKTQHAILRSLSPEVLATVALVLNRVENRGARNVSNERNTK